MSNVEFEQLKKELKTLFSGYKKLTPEMIKKLENLGFVFIRKKTHYIFDFKIQDKSIRFEIAGTPGDCRSGIKKACLISRKIKQEAGL
ncbi:MAG: hypothetical protein K5829_10535 [Treponema sp.]|nr:hypothetical protein [Treponema sp.]